MTDFQEVNLQNHISEQDIHRLHCTNTGPTQNMYFSFKSTLPTAALHLEALSCLS